MSDFYLPPGKILEQGDVFLEIPFPNSKFPLQFFRPSTKQKGMANLFSPDEEPAEPKPGDSLRGNFEFKTVMLASHGCEVEQVERDNATSRRSWLAAPIYQLSDCSSVMQQRTRENRQPNKFYLPASTYGDNREWYVDLRKITPIQCRYFYSATKLYSLNQGTRTSLWSQLGIFYSGLALYQGPIDCPKCGTAIDSSHFVVKSAHDEELD